MYPIKTQPTDIDLSNQLDENVNLSEQLGNLSYSIRYHRINQVSGQVDRISQVPSQAGLINKVSQSISVIEFLLESLVQIKLSIVFRLESNQVSARVNPPSPSRVMSHGGGIPFYAGSLASRPFALSAH